MDQINGIHAVESETVLRWLHASIWLRPRTSTKLVLDRRRFVGGSPFLFATVIERFLALYCSINSFSEMSLSTFDRSPDQQEEVFRWPRGPERSPYLIEALAGGDPGFSFAQAVLALRRMRAEVPEAEGDIGSGPVRFSFERSSRFPAGEVQFVPEQEGGRLQVPFFGVAGPLGPLPAVYADLIERSRETMSMLWALSWSCLKAAFWSCSFSRSCAADSGCSMRNTWRTQRVGRSARGWSGEDGLPFEKRSSLWSAPRSRKCDRPGLPPGAILHYAGRCGPVSMSALEAIVADFFGIPGRSCPSMGSGSTFPKVTVPVWALTPVLALAWI